MPEADLRNLIEKLAESRSIDLRGYKHSTLERRIRRRMAQVGIQTFAEYSEKFQNDPEEMDALLNTVLINVTEFFRDPQAWDVLNKNILLMLLQQLKPGDSFRAWCAGCSSGEEPYSLAILLAERLGDAAPDYDVKIYATDADENALNIARRAEYSSKALRRVRPEWRQRYFQGGLMLRISRELRRNVIFGRSNLLVDAPISHCNLVICRNVLIYFDTEAQEHILSRLHYALEPGGVLWLGKAEPKLNDSVLFRLLNSRWRMFQRHPALVRAKNRDVPVDDQTQETSNAQKELDRLQLQQRLILETVHSGILVLNESDFITQANEAALTNWAVSASNLTGRPIQETELAVRCPELTQKLLSSHGSFQNITFECTVGNPVEERALKVTIRPLIIRGNERAGTLIYCENLAEHAKLQTTVEQLESTSEELQSSNEELETTNEELQSTNEELETTNEELQSTNEELETTNEELQSLNEELENMNEELEARTRELHRLTHRYADTLQNMPWPIMLVDINDKIQLWNTAARKLFGVDASFVVGKNLNQLPIEDQLRKSLLRRCKAVLKTRKASVVRDQQIGSGNFGQPFHLHFTPLARSEDDGLQLDGVLIMFTPVLGNQDPAASAPPTRKLSSSGDGTKKPSPSK